MDSAPPPLPSPTHAGDWRLAQRALAGQPSAWMELVRANQDLVLALLTRHVRPQDREDLFQEVFLRVHRYLGSYRGQSALATWIYQVTFNQIRTHWEADRRRAGREVLAADVRRADPEDDSAWDVPVQPTQEEDLGDAERRQQARRLRELIAAMRPLDRQVLLLRDVDGLPYDAIAARLQVPLGTVKSRLARARGNLARALAADPCAPLARPL